MEERRKEKRLGRKGRRVVGKVERDNECTNDGRGRQERWKEKRLGRKGREGVGKVKGWWVYLWWRGKGREEKGRKVGTERQRRSREGKGIMSVLMMAGGGKRRERKKG
jgi:hypothetical protein